MYINPNGGLIERMICRQGKKLIMIGIILFSFVQGKSQMKECKDCPISAFQSVTAYYIAQPGSGFGFGIEAGEWNKDGSRFSYFLGTKMQWFTMDPNSAKFSNSAENVRFSVYVKGQAMILHKLYFVVTPQLVNLTNFEAGIGFRYTYPLSEVIGVGIEPTYSIVQKEYSLNANIHIAL